MILYLIITFILILFAALLAPFLRILGVVLLFLDRLQPWLSLLRKVLGAAKKDIPFSKGNVYNESVPLDREEAAAILGVKLNASAEEIEAVFKKLIKRNHPDTGGSKYIAEKLIKARETLLKGKTYE